MFVRFNSNRTTKTPTFICFVSFTKAIKYSNYYFLQPPGYRIDRGLVIALSSLVVYECLFGKLQD
jgi:hypothetical protein